MLELNNSLNALRLDFFVDRKTMPDIGKGILNSAVSHMVTKREQGAWERQRERERKLGPNKSGLGASVQQ